MSGPWKCSFLEKFQEFVFYAQRKEILAPKNMNFLELSFGFYFCFGGWKLPADKNSEGGFSFLACFSALIFPAITVIANVIIMSGSVFPAMKSVFIRSL